MHNIKFLMVSEKIEWVDGVGEYIEEQWEKEMQMMSALYCGKHHNFGLGCCLLPCPRCNTFGFYGPRVLYENGEIIRKYRACKFCGLWQEAFGKDKNAHGGKAYRCVAVFCDFCGIYNWQTPWGGFEPGGCPRCHKKTIRINWASDDPNHLFHTWKNTMSDAHRTP